MGQKTLPPGEVSQDRVFVTAFVLEPSDVRVQIGDVIPTVMRARVPGLNHFSVPFKGRTGRVKLAIERGHRQIATAVGPAITDQCEQGNVDWNAFVGSSHRRRGHRSPH